jgi:TolB-like protein/DNA-binding winged helix-turn-helix (wHTH) protein/tetratricopeptide (TPR) repeat protein
MTRTESEPDLRGFRFGSFEVDLARGEVRKAGLPVHLADQQLRLLELLTERPGALVTRDQLRQRLWPADSAVDFERSLNNAMRRLREALGDSAETPRFIETLARRGYRFVASVERLGPPAAAPAAAPSPRAAGRRLRWAAAAVLAVAALALGWHWRRGWPAPAGRRVMIAVLPFENLSDDPGQEYFSDGLTDELIARLGGLDPEGLGVIARTSAMQYKRTSKRADQIGVELGVQYLLESSVRRWRDRLRINVRLVQVSDQTPLWSRSFEGEVSEVLSLQRQVAQAVAEDTRLRLTAQVRDGLARRQAVDPLAYEETLKGRYAWNKRTPAGLREAQAHFEAAIGRDPTYAAAHTGLADAYSLMSFYGGLPPREVFPRAQSAAGRALELDGASAEAHTSLAYVAHRYGWDWPAAERSYRQAIALNPSYATARHWYAEYLMVRGRLDEARQEMQRARTLDPLSPRITLDVGLPDYFTGRYQEAADAARRVAALHPSFAPAQVALQQALERQGRYPEAVQALRRAAEALQAGTAPAQEVERALARDGAAGYWGALLRLAERGWPAAVSPSHRANMHAARGETEQALEWLERAYADRDDELVWVAVEPWYAALRDHARFQALLDRMGLGGSGAQPPLHSYLPTAPDHSGDAQTPAIARGRSPISGRGRGSRGCGRIPRPATLAAGSELGANHRQHGLHHALGRQAGRVQDHGVGGTGERGVGAGGVRVVAGADLALDALQVGLHPRGLQLLEAAQGAAPGIGVHVELHVGVGEDRGADVAPVEHHSPGAAHLLLAGHHLAPHPGMARDRGGHRAHLAAADLCGHVAAVQGDPPAAVAQVDDRLARQAGQGLGVVGGNPRAQGLEPHRAVHGAGVQEHVAQAVGQGLARGGLAGAGGPVHGDDEPPRAQAHRRLRLVGRAPAGRGRRPEGRRGAGPRPRRRASTSAGLSARNCPGSRPFTVSGPRPTRFSLETGWPTASSRRRTSWCLPSCRRSSSQVLFSDSSTRAWSTASNWPSTRTPRRSRARVSAVGTPRTLAW